MVDCYLSAVGAPDGAKSAANKASKLSKRPRKGKQPSEEHVRELLLESLRIRPCSVVVS